MYLSIIVPMYNVEMYIEKCLYSCLKQNIQLNDYEIIVVNDGSIDRSLEIAEYIASQTHNIRIISQINSGLSQARNVGLQNAKGEYVWFVDSDDCIRENCLGEIIKKCKKDDLDILAIGAANVVDDKEIRRFVYLYKDIVSGSEVLNNGHMQHCVPFSIYRRDFLLQYNLNFYPGIFHEDSEFSPRAYFYANRVFFINDILYLVTINPNSITRTINYKKSFDYLKGAISIHNFQEINAIDKCIVFFHNHISLMINNAMANFKIAIDDDKKRLKALNDFSKELYNKRFLFTHLRNSSIFKYKVEGYLFTLFPHYVIRIYLMLQSLR